MMGSNLSEREYCTRKEVPLLLGTGQWTADKLIKRSNAAVYIDGRMIVDKKKLRDYIDSLSGSGQREEIALKELRCDCGKLLGKSNSETEIDCSRCDALVTFKDGEVVKKILKKR